MDFAIYRWMMFGAISLIVTGISFGIAASFLGVSVRKGKLRLVASVLAGSAFSIFGLSTVLLQSRLPTFNIEGVIETAQVHSQGKGYRTDLKILLADGSRATINASDRSNYFRAGEHLKASYQGYSGTILKAIFLSQSGQPEGVYNSTDLWVPYVLFLVSLFLFWAGFRKYRNDPQGGTRV